MKKLPKTPSKLLAIALNDLAKVERSEKYDVYMHTWHTPGLLDENNNQVCQVCLAGAVMAKTLKADHKELNSPFDFKSNKRKLLALDFLRCGEISSACIQLEIENNFMDSVSITEYEEDPVQFKKDIRKLIKDLEKVGM